MNDLQTYGLIKDNNKKIPFLFWILKEKYKENPILLEKFHELNKIEDKLDYLKGELFICFIIYWVLLSGFFSCLFIHFSSLDVRDIFESIITGTIISFALSAFYAVIVHEIYMQGKKI